MYKRNEFFIFRVYEFHIPIERLPWAMITLHGELATIDSSQNDTCSRPCIKTFGSGVGRPSLGSRAWRWRMAAPASAAATAWSVISSGVIGRWGDMVGV